MGVNLVLQRRKFSDKATIGDMVVGDILVVTLEDGKREHKIYGETAIPAGVYKLELRTGGNTTKRYAKRYPDMHRGMVHLLEVPGFSWIYVHVGNYPSDTLGCILVGTRAGDDAIYGSRNAYEAIYPILATAIEGGSCTLEVRD